MSPVNRTVSALALVGAAVSAHAGIINFENLPHGNDDSLYASPVVSGGFTFTSSLQSSASFGAWGPFSGGGTNYTGSVALFNRYGGQTTTMTQVGGGAFALNSIDLANLFVNDVGSTITFTGTKVGGGTVTNVFALGPGPAVVTDSFTGFTGLSSVSWSNVGSYHQFDNIAVTTPGPLAALPFALMAVKRRRRKA